MKAVSQNIKQKFVNNSPSLSSLKEGGGNVMISNIKRMGKKGSQIRNLRCEVYCKYSAGKYMFKVNNRNTRIRCEIRHWRRSGVFIVNFEHISHLVLGFLCNFLRQKIHY